MSSAHFITTEADGTHSLNILVDGMHCPSCVAIIENALKKESSIQTARLNLSTKRLRIVWRGVATLGDSWVELINNMGYRAMPFDPATAETAEKKEEKFLLRCMAVSGFASGNLMLFSVPLWSSDPIQMGEATRTFFHWIQALIAIPAAAYAGIPFFASAFKALRAYKTNMDVPISVAVILATLMSLFETITFGRHSYFDSVIMLLFFLLIGRYLEARAKGRARSAAHDLLQMMTGFATILNNGTQQTLPLSELKEGMILFVSVGEKIGADGEIISGESELDTSLITGETMPQPVGIGMSVFAGTLNVAAPLTIKITKPAEKSLLSDIIKLMETAEQSQAKYVTLADRISGWYTPAVHVLAAATFLGWFFIGNIDWQLALLYAATVLIITCPCALGLAVPVVQVLASGKLMRAGILLKSGSALERLAGITHAVFDKTGTLTLGKPILTSKHNAQELHIAASLAAHSKHPLSRAIVHAYTGEILPLEVQEVQGCGLEAQGIRLGKRIWAAPEQKAGNDESLELWLTEYGKEPVRFTFSDKLRADAKNIINILHSSGIKTLLLSGDRQEVTASIAKELDIKEFSGCLTPLKKTEKIYALKSKGINVLMVGDGLNDAPSLSNATISMSPTSAMDITQNAADIVFQGDKLQPVITAWRTAQLSQKLVYQNFLLAIGYNVIAIPIAVAGFVTPLIAAIAMSSSSLLVIANAMRLNLHKEEA